jgi:hypothetical protein
MRGQRDDRVRQIQGSHRQAKRLFDRLEISESPTSVTMGQDGACGDCCFDETPMY